jgi:glycosyltransferase involved in cell wall biosynthesis
MKLPSTSNRGLMLEKLPPAPAGKTGWPWTEPAPPLTVHDLELPKISIITPSFNQGEFLEQTIRSVLLQGYPNIEHIIIDGGSTDESVTVIRKYEPWLAYWCSEKDRGHTHGINKGLAKATGQILCWLNSDDYFLPGALLTVGQTLAEGCGRYALVGHCYRVHGDGTPPLLLKGHYQNRRRLLEVWKRYRMHQPAIFWRREVFEKVSWLDESLPLTVDFDYWARIARHFDFVNVDRVLACANHHAAMKNNDDYADYHREMKKNVRRYWPSLLSPQRWGLELSMIRHDRAHGRRQRSCTPRFTVSPDEFSLCIRAKLATATNPRAEMERMGLPPALQSILENGSGQPQSVAEGFPELCQKMINQLFDEIQSDVLTALRAGWSANRSQANFLETPWAFFEFAHEDWEDLYSVRLESQPELGLVVLGLWHNQDNGIGCNEQIALDLKRLGWGNKPGGPWWDGQSPLPEPFTNWTTASGVATLAIQRAELKSLLTEEIVKLCAHFKNSLAELAKAATPP